MSIPVELLALESATAEYGWAYLLTVSDAGTPKIVALTPTWDGDEMVLGVGGGSARNVAARPSVTVAYPPLDPEGYTLIVDGEARVTGDDEVRFAPSGAVLHRPAPAGFVNTATGCGHDCAPVESTTRR
jgi:hypothetical protein